MHYVYLATCYDEDPCSTRVLAIFEDKWDCEQYVDKINQEEEFKERPAWVDEHRLVLRSSEAMIARMQGKNPKRIQE